MPTLLATRLQFKPSARKVCELFCVFRNFCNYLKYLVVYRFSGELSGLFYICALKIIITLIQ